MSLFNDEEEDFEICSCNKHSSDSINEISFDVKENLDYTCEDNPTKVEVQTESSNNCELYVSYSSNLNNSLPVRQYRSKKLYQTVAVERSTKLVTTDRKHVKENLDNTCNNNPIKVEVKAEFSSDCELYANYSSNFNNSLPIRQYRNRKLYQTVTDKRSSIQLSSTDQICAEDNIDMSKNNACISTFCTELLINDDKYNTSSWELFSQVCEQQNIKSQRSSEDNEQIAGENDCLLANNFNSPAIPLLLDIEDKESIQKVIQSERMMQEKINSVLPYRFLHSYLEIEDEMKGTIEQMNIPYESTQANESHTVLPICTEVSELVPRDQSESTSSSNTEEFKCNKCLSTFANELKFKKHFDLHFKSLKCKKCNRFFKYVQTFERHIKSDICTKRKLKMREHRIKMKEIRKKTVFNCRRCGICCKSRNELEEHQKSHINEKKKYFCHECPESFSFHKQLSTHLLEHPVRNNNECSFCSEMFGSSLSLNTHLRKCGVNAKYLCTICKKSFVTKPHLVTHFASIHSGKRPFSCSFCEQRFALKTLLNKHIKSSHSGIKHYTCCKCNKRFRTSTEFNTHKIVHTDVKPFKCNRCSLRFSLLANLKRHLHIHSEEKQFHCAICKKSFFQKQSLACHIKSHHLPSHPKPKPKKKPSVRKCSVCYPNTCDFNCPAQQRREEMKFKRKIEPKKEYPKKFLCHICGIKYTTAKTLSYHLNSHINVRPYKCSMCKVCFTSPYYLKVHSSLHKAREYLCSKCGMAFSQYNSFSAHLKIHTGVQPYSCSICNRRFAELRAQKRHMKLHEEERLFECAYCKQSFYHKIILINHIQSQHSVHPV